MKAKICLIFGGTGQIGTNLIRKLAKNNYKITIVSRNLHQKGNFIKTQANAGYIKIIETNPFDKSAIAPLFKNIDICINLVGILFEKGKNNFRNIHINFPNLLSSLCKENNVKQFIHVSALGLEEALDSEYAKSKIDGEKKIKEVFTNATILKPSVVYSIDDNFTTTFMSLLTKLPIFPLYYNGNTKFMPIHCSDLTDIILNVMVRELKSETIECGGPEIITFKKILLILMDLIDRKRLLLPMPFILASMVARLLQIMPNPLLTIDQLKLLKYDNVYSKKYKTNIDFGMLCKKNFRDEVKKYCFMWREGGQFSTEKYTSTK